MWQPIETAPINKNVLLWNQETQEISIGYKPEGAPTDGVVVAHTASYADAWLALPEPPQLSDDEDHD